MNVITKRFLSGKVIASFKRPIFRSPKFISILLVFFLSLMVSGWTIEANTVKIPIFGFHDIINVEDPTEMPPRRPEFDTDYTQQNFAKFLEYLGKEHYWLISAQDLFMYFIQKSKPIPVEHLGQKPVMISFDDGYLGVHKNALPVLELVNSVYKIKGKFVLFINPQYLGVDYGKGYVAHLTYENLREGYKKGLYDIQSHGLSHKDLTKLDQKELEVELGEAKKDLRKATRDLDKNKIVSAHLAYPYGSTNRKVQKLLPKYYLTGFLYDNGILRVNRLKNPYRISRITVGRRTAVQDLMEVAEMASTLRKTK